MTKRLADRNEPIPGYRLMERLGRGGFGEVWKCEAPGGLHKAIKFVFGDIESMGEDGKPAEQELKALHRVKSIRHPYILSLERFEVIEGQLVIVMELADRNLWDRFRECRGQSQPGIPREELLSYMDEAAEALDLMNQAYMIQHLDIKPQNIFLVHNHIKVADFGLAKDLENMRATITGGVTPVYAAPETFNGEITPYCDQYSLAIVYQELLTGRRPYTGSNTRQLVVQHINGQPDLSPLPEGDQDVIGRALSKEASRRFPSCADMVRALRDSHSRDTPTGGNLDDIPEEGPKTLPAGRGALVRATTPRRPLGRSTIQTPPPAGRSRNTGLPILTTPRQINDSRGSFSVSRLSPREMLRDPDAMVTQIAREVLAPPERTGDGVLLPALIVGLGRSGYRMIRELRSALRERFGPSTTFPHLHFLYVDTDPESTANAANPSGDGLPADRVLLARLNRPSHYLKREGLPSVESWLSPQLLYRMPKTPRTDGIRAFGRLALCDNYRDLIVRLRASLNECARMELLNRACEQTGLGFRTNVPRVYILSGLEGGTGSGMFIDLAYLCRSELRGMGYLKPEVIGLFPLPPSGRNADRKRAANCFAALSELNHFSSPGTCYEARFDEREPVLVDAERPFSRCVFLGLPKDSDERTRSERLAGMAGQLLCEELFSPLGRLTDASRAEFGVNSSGDADSAWCQVAGMFRFSWPRAAMVRIGTRRLGMHLLKKWASKQTEPFREQLLPWVNDEWKRRLLDAQSFIDALHGEIRNELGRPPEEVFSEILEPVNDPKQNPKRYDAISAANLLDRLIDMLGRPETEKELHPGVLTESLTRAGRSQIRSADQRVAEMANQFVEEPDYRLPAAEAVVGLLTDKIKTTLASLEVRTAELEREGAEILSKLLAQIGMIAARGHGINRHVVELLNAYPPKRYQAIILQAVQAIYRSLLGALPERLRDFDFSRMYLENVINCMREVGENERSSPAVRAGQLVLPEGRSSPREVCESVLREIPSAEIHAMEDRLQAQIRKHFGSLTLACQKGDPAGEALRAVIESETASFLEAHFPRSSAIDVFFRGNGEHSMTTHREILTAFDEAAPGIPIPASVADAELNVLGVPQGERGHEFRDLVREVLAGEELVPLDSTEDILFYREIRHMSLVLLPQLNPTAQAAYEQGLTDAAAPPHSRNDVGWQLHRDPLSGTRPQS